MRRTARVIRLRPTCYGFFFLWDGRPRLSDRVETEAKHALLADFPVVIRFPVHSGDQDAFGHVNNIVPHRWFESARIALFGRIGLLEPRKEQHIGPILAAVSCNYRRQINSPTRSQVGIRVARIGRTSMGYEHVIVSEDAGRRRRRRNVDNRRLRLPRPASPGARIRSAKPSHHSKAAIVEQPRAASPSGTPAHAPIPVGDLDDPRLAIYRSLKATNQTRALDQFVVEGERLVARLLESRFPPVSVLVTDRHLPASKFTCSSKCLLTSCRMTLIDRLVVFPFTAACWHGPSGARPPIEEIARSVARSSSGDLPEAQRSRKPGLDCPHRRRFGIEAIMTAPSAPTRSHAGRSAFRWGRSCGCPSSCQNASRPTSIARSSSRPAPMGGRNRIPSALPFDQVIRPHRLGLILGDEDRGIELGLAEPMPRTDHHPDARGARGSLNVAVAAGILINGLFRR